MKTIMDEKECAKRTTASRICIVDDNEAVRESIGSLLHSVGYQTSLFASGDAFLNSDGARLADCLILDVRMDGLGGLELQHRLTHMGCSIPTIFISGDADEGLRAKALQQGAVAWLDKPLQVEVLLRTIDLALSHK